MSAKIRLTASLLAATIVASLAVAAAVPPVAAATDARAPLTTRLAESATPRVAGTEVSGRLAGVRLRTATPVTAPAARTQTVRAATAVSPSSELARAQAILAGLVKKYPILKGATVSIGDAKGYQAICYYKSGRIVISTTHKASLERIINHEIWHIIDWRDNGRIDWGENVPPRQ